MDISVTEFKARCLDLIRRVEKRGASITIRRRGKIVARLEPAQDEAAGREPWAQLRALGGKALVAPAESVLRTEDFEAMR